MGNAVTSQARRAGRRPHNHTTQVDAPTRRTAGKWPAERQTNDWRLLVRCKYCKAGWGWNVQASSSLQRDLLLQQLQLGGSQILILAITCDVGAHEHVAWWLRLVGTVCAPQLLHRPAVDSKQTQQ